MKKLSIICHLKDICEMFYKKEATKEQTQCKEKSSRKLLHLCVE